MIWNVGETMAIEKKTIKGKIKYRYRRYYTDEYGNRKQKNSKWYDTKREASKAEAEFVARAKEFKVVNQTTFYQIQCAWFEEWSKTVKPTTISTKVEMLKKFKQLHDKFIGSITTDDVIDLFESDNLDCLSVRTKNNELNTLNQIFKYALKLGAINSNPVADIPKFKLPEEEKLKEMTIYSYDEFMRFHDALKTIDEDTADACWLFFWTGLRRNELLSLTFSDFDGKSIYVHRQYVNGKWQTLKSSASVRRINLDAESIRIINKQHDRYSKFKAFNDEWFVIGGCKQKGRELLAYHRNKASELVGLPRIRFHDFRHSHASYLIDQGVDIFKISKRLGHAKVSMTLDVYGHLLDKNEDEILNVMNKNIKNKTFLRH